MKKYIISALMFSVCMAVFADPIKVTDESQLVYLEFVQANGNAGIKTKYVPNENTAVKFKGAFMKNVAYTRLFMNSVTAGQKTSTGATVSNAENHDVCRVIAQGNTSSIYANCSFRQGSAAAFSLSLSLGQIFEGEMDVNSVTINGQSLDTSARPRTKDNPNEIILLDHEKNSSVRLYYVEFSEGDEVLYSFVPCAYDNVIGVYDKVNGEFYPQTLGTGTLSGSSFVVEIGDSYPLTSLGVEPEVVVRDLTSGAVLEKDVDYTVTYTDNTLAGTASATVTHIPGGKCFGTAVVNFTIYPVYRVTPDAAGGGDGASWASAMTLGEAGTAIAALSAGSKASLYLKEGYYEMTSPIGITNINSIIKGGFKGTEDDAFSSDDSISVLDGMNQMEYIVSYYQSSSERTDIISRVEFKRARYSALDKSVQYYRRGHLSLSDCRFIANGAELANEYPNFKPPFCRAFSVWAEGSDGQFNVSVACTNCYFGGNVASDVAKNNYLHPVVILNSARSAEFIGCTFVTNGLPWTRPNGYSSSNTLVSTLRGVVIGSVNTERLVVKDCKFIANSAVQSGNSITAALYIYQGAGVWYKPETLVERCLFLGNQSKHSKNNSTSSYYSTPYSGGLAVENLHATHTAVVDQCTFAYNVYNSDGGAAALSAYKGPCRVRNSIFFSNILSPLATSGSDLTASGDGGVIDVDYCSVTSLETTNVTAIGSSQIVAGGFIKTGDPLFKTGIDEFLPLIEKREAYGRINEEFKADISVAEALCAFDVRASSDESLEIDGGDPDSPYGNEPVPNGSRVNLGIYGNTAEAHTTPVSQPALDDGVKVTFPYESTQPHVSFAMGGEGAYNATAVVSYSTNGVDFVRYHVYDGLKNGDEISFDMFLAFNTGDNLTIKVEVSAYGADAVEAEKTEELIYPRPESFGRGGGDGVLHIRAGATGDGSGSDWFNAVPDYASLQSLIAKSPREIWIAGDWEIDSTIDIIQSSVPVTIRGGFTGIESDKNERKASSKSIIDGMHSYPTMRIENTSATVEIEGFVFRHSYVQGLRKTGSGDIKVYNCVFQNNFKNHDNKPSIDSDSTEKLSNQTDISIGQGALLKGSGGATEISVSNCVFEGNFFTYKVNIYNYYPVPGLRVEDAARAYIDDSLFLTNGYPLTQTEHSIGQGMRGSALCAKNSPVTVRRCVFRSNRSPARHTGTNYRQGGVVYLEGNSGGSAFTNCLWIGNSSDFGLDQSLNTDVIKGQNHGAVSIKLSKASQTVSFMNCTFAGNLNDSFYSPSSINAMVGSVDVSHCLFEGNICGKNLHSAVGTEILSFTNCSVNVDWCVFDTPLAKAAKADGGELVLGENIFISERNLATGRSVYEGLVVTNSKSCITYDVSRSTDVLMSASGHLCGGRGYIDEKTGELVTVYIRQGRSAALDAGDPTMSYSKEPVTQQGYHGKRINIGAYGNTPWATMSTYPGAVLRLR